MSMHDIGVTVALLQPRFEIARTGSRLIKKRIYNVISANSNKIYHSLFALFSTKAKRWGQGVDQSSGRIRVDPDQISYCSMCFKTDPGLPDDMDLIRQKGTLV